MRYKLILLDIDDTIFDFQAGNRNAVNELAAELGLASPTVFDEYQVHNHACWEALERGEMTQEILHAERFRRFLASKNRDDDPKAVADRFAELLGRQAIWMEGAQEMVRALHGRVPMVVLTNGITVIQKARLARSELSKWVDRVVISQEVGASKPDPRIFEIALDGVSPADALMIGDSLNSDILGANRAGIDSCWFNPKGKACPEHIRPTYEAATLEECARIALSE